MRVTYLERSPGVWRLRIETGRDQSGKRLFAYETVRGDEEAAQRRRFEVLQAHEERSFAVPDKVTLAQFFERYVETKLALGKIGRSSAENYRTHFRVYVAPVLGGRPLQKISGAEVQALYTKLLKDGLALATVEHVHRGLFSPLFRTARKQRLVTANPMEEVEAPRADRPAPKALAEHDVERLVEGLPGKWFATPVLLALATGLRRGEVLGLRRCDVDLAVGKLRVAGQLLRYDDGSMEWKAPKTKGSVRSLSLPREAVELLRGHIRTATEVRMKLGLGNWRDADYIFTVDGVTPMRPDDLTRDFTDYCRAIGLEGFTFHGTRHTHATLLLKRVGKTGAKAVSQRLGHANIKITLETYQTVFEEDDQELADMAGSLIGGRK